MNGGCPRLQLGKERSQLLLKLIDVLDWQRALTVAGYTDRQYEREQRRVLAHPPRCLEVHIGCGYRRPLLCQGLPAVGDDRIVGLN